MIDDLTITGIYPTLGEREQDPYNRVQEVMQPRDTRVRWRKQATFYPKEGKMVRRLSTLVVSICLLAGVAAFSMQLNSGLTLANDGSFYAICDDKGANVDPPGVLYKLNIDLDASGIHGVDVVGIVHLKTPDGSSYTSGSIDAEDVLWTPTDFIACSERDQDNNPWIRQFSHDGTFLSEVPVSEKFMPASEGDTQVRGTRTNLSFEASALTPDYATLYVMNEEALLQDAVRDERGSVTARR